MQYILVRQMLNTMRFRGEFVPRYKKCERHLGGIFVRVLSLTGPPKLRFWYRCKINVSCVERRKVAVTEYDFYLCKGLKSARRIGKSRYDLGVLSNIKQWPGQFIGLRPNNPSSSFSAPFWPP